MEPPIILTLKNRKKMPITKLLSDMAESSKGTDMAEISNCIATLIKTKSRMIANMTQRGLPQLATQYNNAISEITYAASTIILGLERPTSEELRSLTN